MDAPASFGQWLRERRQALDLTRAALAHQVGCAVITIKKIETDERRPSRQIAERLADRLVLGPEERAAFLKMARAELGAVSQRSVGKRPTHADERPLPNGTVTFLFTDIERSSQLWEQHGDAMRMTLARHEAIVRS